MQVIFVDSKKPKALPKDTALCIGNFDGIHKGHQELIKRARLNSSNVAVMTFDPHPEALIKGIDDVRLLTPLAEKIDVFEEYGVDIVLVVKFDINMMKMEKNDFISFLSKLKFKRIVCGHDFRFGYLGMGNPEDLKKAFETDVVSKYLVNGQRASSSKIREALMCGDIDTANEMLGRCYHIYGRVIYGAQKGREIGFPTANIDYDDFYLLECGVYIVKVIFDGIEYYGMANVGHNPTMNLKADISLEVHIFDFDMDIYGRRLDVYFIERIRPEKKFANVYELVLELGRNKAYGVAKYLNK